MRRGGGSRGGGSRGGGGRSRGSSSRGYRTSRRHRRRRRHGYYGRRGYGYYGYGNGGGFLFALIAFFVIIVLIVVIISSAALGNPTDTSVNLGPNENRAFQPGFWKNGIAVTDDSGIIETHFFSSAPSIASTTIDRIIFETDNVANFEFEFWAFYLIKGSTIDISWTSTRDLTMWIIAGNDDFKEWKDGVDKGTSFTRTTNFVHDFTAAGDNDYYFVFEATIGSATVDVTFDVKSRVYDISTSSRMITGTFSETNVDESHVVVHNPSGTDLTFKVSQTPRFGSGVIFVVMSIVIIGSIVVFARRRSASKAKSESASPQYTQSHSPTEVSSQNVHALYNQRPSAKFCTACGSGILPSSSFCTECGTKV